MTSRIEDYAIIGDGRTAALVSRSGSIDWLCLPRFDSEACCAALVGTTEHGYWQIRPVQDTRVERRYDGDTLVLHTDFAGESGRVRLVDFMAIGQQNPVLIRRVIGLEGNLHLRCEVRLRFDYGLMPPLLTSENNMLLAVSGPALLALCCPLALMVAEDDCAYVEFDVSARQVMDFVLIHCPSHERPPAGVNVSKALDATMIFWRDWMKGFQRRTESRDAVVRSLLTLKALTYHATGAMIAAPTTSLPEVPAGTSNWDYRYCWLRDATFTVSALLNAGFHQEAVDWRDWMLRAMNPMPGMSLPISIRCDNPLQALRSIRPVSRYPKDPTQVCQKPHRKAMRDNAQSPAARKRTRLPVRWVTIGSPHLMYPNVMPTSTLVSVA
jgi:GH15 family glucan-1,4-alpha-glucosidase